jgi:hypothetical protein
MNRRNFLTKLGIGAAACAVVPSVIQTQSRRERLKDAVFYESTEEDVTYDSGNMTFEQNTGEILLCPDGMTPKHVMEVYRRTGVFLFKETGIKVSGVNPEFIKPIRV